jgi:hypothetical protein
VKIRIIPVAAGLAGATALAITGATLASVDSGPAATTSTTAAIAASSDTATATPQPPNGNGNGNGNTDPSKPMRSDEQLLTGATAQKVTAAAKAKEPGATIQRVETDSDGVYDAHMLRADGTPIIVQVGKDFTVTAVLEGGPAGRPGAGGTGGTSSSGSATPSSA